MSGSQIAPPGLDHEVSAKDITDILAVLTGKRAMDITLTGTVVASGEASFTGSSVVIDHLVRQAAKVTHGSHQEVTNLTNTYVLFNSEDEALGCFDNDTIHDTSTNISRLTCKTAGTYLIQGNIEWSNASAGGRALAVELNRTVDIAFIMQKAVSTDAVHVSVLYKLAVNDYVELRAYQDSGGSLDIQSTANSSPVFSMVRLF